MPRPIEDYGEDETSLLLSSGINSAPEYEFHRPRPTKKNMICKLVGVTTLVASVVVVCILIFLYVPRAPRLTLLSSQIISIARDPLSATFNDTLQVENPNFASVSLLSYEYFIYHDGIIVGKGVDLQQPVFPKREIGQFVAQKTLIDNEEYPQLIEVLKDCNATGTFTLDTEVFSKWSYLLSTRTLILQSRDVYSCYLS